MVQQFIYRLWLAVSAGIKCIYRPCLAMSDGTGSPGVVPGYIVFPSHKNNVYIFSKVYCYLCGKRKFLAVRGVALLTNRVYLVDRQFPVTFFVIV